MGGIEGRMQTPAFGGTGGTSDCVAALRWITRWIFITCVVVVAASYPLLSADTATEKNVLVLCSFSPEIVVQLEPLKKTVRSRVPVPVNFYVEYLDTKRFDSPGYRESLKESIHQAYLGKHFDLVIAAAHPALQFAIDYRDQIFHGAPIIFVDVHSSRLPRGSLWPGVTGVTVPLDARGSIDLALRFHPDTQNVAVVAGNSEFERYWLNVVGNELRQHHNKLKVIEVSTESTKLLFEQVSELSTHTIIFFQLIPQESSQQDLGVYDVLAAIARRFPTYCIFDICIDYGAIGGSYPDDALTGVMGGELAARVLDGEKPENIPIIDNSVTHFKVDWRQLRRWNISESVLPPGTIVVNREPGPWQKYKAYVLAALLILTLQLFLIVILLWERRQRVRSQHQLEERLRFETLLAQIASSLSAAGPGEVDYPIQQCLRGVRDFFDVNRASIWQLQPESDALLLTHVWPEDAAIRSAVNPEHFPHTVQRLARGEIVQFANEFERSSLMDCDAFRDAGAKSFLAIPLKSDENAIRVFSLIGESKATYWSSEIVTRLRTIADMLGHVLARQNATKALRESELLKGSILESLRSNVCVIDNAGVILEVNQSWVDFAAENSMERRSTAGVGVNYLEICRESDNGEESAKAVSGIVSVLDGSRHSFEMEYECHSPNKQRWFRMSVMGLPRPKGGAVISHTDITAQTLAEFEQQRMKEETAQMNRATEMGQLVASLAHELAQPLAAVLSNAQAASRLASRPDLDLVEIKTAIADIIEDDQRASAVLNHVRTILKKHTVVPHKVNLNQIVEDVILIVRNNAQLRGVQLKSALYPDAVLVRGDEVPLQQVLLNLVLNAMDAVAHLPAERRVLTVKTCVRDGCESGVLAVEDEGPGVPDGLRAKLFTPFFTTKTEGLGMGLAICSAILTSLGGSINFKNRSERGATFEVELPLASNELAA
jgi:signal transduction histidine kinase/ABC-type uncharacterized transport system substrate-binding protein